MKRHSMFPNSLQKLISDEELQPLIELVGYEDIARKVTVKTLIQYFVTAAVSEWKILRHCSEVGNSIIVHFLLPYK